MVPSRFLYLVRHGEADDEGGLTEAGRQQAGAAGERLRNVRFSVIRHSPEQRAEAYSPEERAEGAELAAAAIRRYARPADRDGSELIVTHNFLIGWFVRHALGAPDERWMGLNQCNGGLTVILYRTGQPASLVSFNDVGHLPPSLRWTGFPAEIVPPPR
jgi:serine/threonine-protein phosphatase PGAM5